MSKEKKPQISLRMVKKMMVRGIKLQDFIDGQWRYRKKGQRKRDNPASIFRNMLKRAVFYQHLSAKEKRDWDKKLGQLYLYCDEKIDGFVL